MSDESDDGVDADDDDDDEEEEQEEGEDDGDDEDDDDEDDDDEEDGAVTRVLACFLSICLRRLEVPVDAPYFCPHSLHTRIPFARVEKT